MDALFAYARSVTVLGLILFAVWLLPASAHADIYKCTKDGAVSFQEMPCAGANVQSTHIESRASEYFVGCFETTDSRVSQIIEVRANGAGAYQLVDERNPLGSGIVLKKATSDELLAVSNGLHIKIDDGLDRHIAQSATVSTTRVGNRYVASSIPVAQTITAASLYGIYRGKDSEGMPITLYYTGGVPQVIAKVGCPTY